MTDNQAADIAHSNTPIFSPMQAFTLPAEAWYLVNDPKITKAELKVTLCVLFNSFGSGVDGSGLTFTYIQQQTGMSKSSVLAGLEEGMARGSIFKRTVAGQITYEPGSKKFEPMTCHESCHEHGKNFKTQFKTNTCHVSEIEPRQKIFATLLEFGLATHVAENIAMTSRYKIELLEEQLAFIRFEHEQGLLPKRQSAIPGYIVNRIKFDRIPPQGYASGGDGWFTPEESQLFER